MISVCENCEYKNIINFPLSHQTFYYTYCCNCNYRYDIYRSLKENECCICQTFGQFKFAYIKHICAKEINGLLCDLCAEEYQYINNPQCHICHQLLTISNELPNNNNCIFKGNHSAFGVC